MHAPTVTIWEDTGFFLAARLKGNAGTLITQVTISSIALKVFDKSDYSQVHSSAPVVADSVFNTLQTSDPRWTLDSKGYNVGIVVPASAFATAGDYLTEVVFTPTTGDKLALVVNVIVKELHSS